MSSHYLPAGSEAAYEAMHGDHRSFNPYAEACRHGDHDWHRDNEKWWIPVECRHCDALRCVENGCTNAMSATTQGAHCDAHEGEVQ